MDSIIQDKVIHINCRNHPKQRIQYIQTSEIKKDKNLFYCQYCSIEDNTFKSINYALIDQMQDNTEDSLIENWPPLDDRSCIQKIKLYNQECNKQIEHAQGIEDFFDDLKSKVVEKIEQTKKKMILHLQRLPDSLKIVLDKYQEISNINSIKTILSDSNTDFESKQHRYREILSEFLSQKSNNTQSFESVLKQFEKTQGFVDYSKSNEIKSSIIKLIDSIDTFVQELKIDILPQFEMVKTNYNISQSSLVIEKDDNNQIQISQHQNGWTNTVSDMILNPNSQYIFRFEFENLSQQQQKQVMVGLVRDQVKDSQQGFTDYLSCYFYFCENSYYQNGYGIDKPEKGNFSTLRQDQTTFELRVCIKEQKLQISDYPKQNHILSLSDSYKNRITDFKDLRLFFAMCQEDMNIKLIEVYQIN